MTAPIRPARPDDWPAIATLLTGADLPQDGAIEHLADFVVAERDGVMVGCAGMERYGTAGLLRSVVVMDAERGTGLGTSLVDAVLLHARQSGIATMTLLTTTAAGFFPRFGFAVTDRASVPAVLLDSVEFRSACPSTATVMHASLAKAYR